MKKIAWGIGLSAIIGLALIQIAFRLVFASVSHYQEHVTQLVSAALHKPVKIAKLHATWHGLQPVFKMRGVQVFDANSTQTVAQIDRVMLGVDLIESWRKHHWVPGELMICGVDLQIALNQKSEQQHNVLTFVDELLSSGDKVLKNININLTLASGKTRRITDINAIIRSSGDRHRVRGVLHLDGKQSASLIADVRGSVLKPAHFRGNVYLREKKLDLAALQDWMPARLRRLSGRLDQEVWFELHGLHHLKLVQTNGRFYDLSVPEYQHLDGRFWATPQRAQVVLDSRRVQVKDPTLWPKPFTVQRVQTTLNWQRDTAAQVVKIPHFRLQAPGLTLAGQMALVFQDYGASPQVSLAAQFHSEALGQLAQYFPEKGMPTKLVHWLRSALVAGSAQGELLWQGPFAAFPYAEGRGQIALSADVSNASLRYAKDWPVVDQLHGHLSLDNQRVRFVANQGRLLQQQFASANASIDDVRQNVLRINTRLQGDIQNGLALVHQSPLEKTLGKELAPLHLTGPMKMNLHLRWPLKKDKRALHVMGDVALLGGQLELTDWRLVLKNMRGRFQFTERDLQSAGIQSTLHHLPLNMTIQTQRSDNEPLSHTVVQLQGQLSPQVLPSLAGAIQGQAPFQATLTLRRSDDQQPDHFHLQTTLRGMALNLPEPLNKAAEESAPLELDTHFSERRPMRVAVHYREAVHARAKIKQHALQALAIQFGPDVPVTLDENQISVAGELAQVNVSEWVKRLFKPGQPAASLPPLTHLDLHVDKLIAFEQILPQVKFALEMTPQTKIITVRSRQTNGEIRIPATEAHQAISATFDRLHFRGKKRAERSLLRPQDLPPLNITVNDFSFEELPLGRFQLSITPEQNTLKINALSFKSKLMSLSLTGHWREYQGHHDTALSGAMYTHNLGRMLNVFDLTSNMINGDGRAVFKLSWDDSLVNFATEKLNGRVRFGFTGGQIVELGEQTATQLGLGRVLNLFSLQTIPRRLSLDFSDLTREGFAFDDLSGDFVLRDGDAFSQNAKIKGPVAEVTMRGRLGLASKDYQLELAITPHVTSSLPVVAAVAGGPAAGMATWVVEKLFSRAVNKATTVLYRVEGPWEHPNFVKLRRIVRPKRV